MRALGLARVSVRICRERLELDGGERPVVYGVWLWCVVVVGESESDGRA